MNTSVINEPKLVVTVSEPKKTGLELAEEDKAKGRVTRWNYVDEMFDTVLGE